MLRTYGFKITGFRPGAGVGAYLAREVEAPDARTAREYVEGWLRVEGYGTAISYVELIADGMTFREHMARELVNLGACMSLRFGASMEGPFAHEGDGEAQSGIRLYLPNGRGVSVASTMNDQMLIRSEVAAIREDSGDRHGFTFDGAGVQDYPESTSIGDGCDERIAEILAGLAELPRK